MDTEAECVVAATVIPLLVDNASGKVTHVLLGQAEVVNWFKSSPGNTQIMRYAGEFKFPGGAKDAEDASELHSALRELNEEFLLQLAAADVALHLFNVKRTRPVKGKAFIVHQFVALSHENAWLQSFDIAATNQKLRERRETFFAHHFESFAQPYDTLDDETKARIAPEVSTVQWWPIDEAINMMHGSMDPEQLSPINAFQEAEFQRLAITKRDPMMQSMKTIMEVQSFGDAESILKHCRETELALMGAAQASEPVKPFL